MQLDVINAIRNAANALDAFRDLLNEAGTEEADAMQYEHQPGLSAFCLREIANHLEKLPKEML